MHKLLPAVTSLQDLLEKEQDAGRAASPTAVTDAALAPSVAGSSQPGSANSVGYVEGAILSDGAQKFLLTQEAPMAAAAAAKAERPEEQQGSPMDDDSPLVGAVRSFDSLVGRSLSPIKTARDPSRPDSPHAAYAEQPEETAETWCPPKPSQPMVGMQGRGSSSQGMAAPNAYAPYDSLLVAERLAQFRQLAPGRAAARAPGASRASAAPAAAAQAEPDFVSMIPGRQRAATPAAAAPEEPVAAVGVAAPEEPAAAEGAGAAASAPSGAAVKTAHPALALLKGGVKAALVVGAVAMAAATCATRRQS